MIADDSDAIRLVLKDIISMSDNQYVGEAKDGQDTIDQFEKLNPDILLLDLAMPKKSGLEVINELKPRFPHSKIIVVTASGSEKYMNQCLDAGASDYVSKPFDAKDILSKISNK